jgi:hypothetical protein
MAVRNRIAVSGPHDLIDVGWPRFATLPMETRTYWIAGPQLGSQLGSSDVISRSLCA